MGIANRLEDFYNRYIARLISFVTSKGFKTALVLIISIITMLFISGLVFCIVNLPPPVVSIWGMVYIFYPDPMSQTSGELIVIFVYLLMAFAGVWLYIKASSERVLTRAVKYMYFFSFILLLIAFIGILLGIQAKY